MTASHAAATKPAELSGVEDISPAPSLRRVREIDSLRCFAMTAVVAQHCHLLPFGWLGVWLFFVISGYVVTTSVQTQDRGGSAWRRLGDFFLRRTVRIVPIYYAYVIVGVAVGLTLGAPFAGEAVTSLLLFWNNVAMAFGRGELTGWPVGHLWTISVEMQFYMVYGVALVLLRRAALMRLLIGLLVLGPLLRLAATFWLPHIFHSDLSLAYAVYSGSGLHFDSFAAGGLLALNIDRIRAPKAALRLFLLGAVVFAAYAMIYVLVNILVRHQTGIHIFKNIVSGVMWGEYRQVFVYSAVALAASGLVAMAIARHGAFARVLGWRPFQWVGEISYGAYVYHVLMLAACGWAFARLATVRGVAVPYLLVGPITFLIAWPAAVGFAYLSFRFVETPLLRTVHRGARPATPTAPDTISLAPELRKIG